MKLYPKKEAQKVPSNPQKDLLDLCEKIIDASLYWTGEDEERNPTLKTIRTLAGFYLDKYA